MLEEIYEKFKLLSKRNIVEYNQKLVPNCKKVYGVSIPLLRKLAKEIISMDYTLFLKACDGSSFELQLLEGYVIAGAKLSVQERLNYLKTYIPKLENWAMCDGLVASLKCTKKHSHEMFNLVEQFKNSKKEFEVRFVAVFLMSYYLKDDTVEQAVTIVENLYLHAYYAKMGVAWFIATLMVKYPKYAMRMIQNPKMDEWTIHKAILKMRESYRISNIELNQYLNTLKPSI